MANFENTVSITRPVEEVFTLYRSNTRLSG